PMVTLAYLAAGTTDAELGTLVVCNSFREPGQLGREALALADASAGRFILGLGAGWHQPEYDGFGIPFDHKVSRLEETLETRPRPGPQARSRSASACWWCPTRRPTRAAASRSRAARSGWPRCCAPTARQAPTASSSPCPTVHSPSWTPPTRRRWPRPWPSCRG